MILTRQAGSVPSLQSVSSVQGRRAADPLHQQHPGETGLVIPLEDRQEEEITTRAREMLLKPFSGVRR